MSQDRWVLPAHALNSVEVAERALVEDQAIRPVAPPGQVADDVPADLLVVDRPGGLGRRVVDGEANPGSGLDGLQLSLRSGALHAAREARSPRRGPAAAGARSLPRPRDAAAGDILLEELADIGLDVL